MKKLVFLGYKGIIISCCIIGSILYCLYFMFIETPTTQAHTPLSQQISFLQQPKDIEQKDFLSLINTLYTTKRAQEAPIKDKDIAQEKRSLPPPKLHAIVNQSILVDTTWLHLHQHFSHDGQEYILKEIKKDTAILESTTHAGNTLYLKIFSLNENILFEMLD